MAEIVMIKLKKHFAPNIAGETAGFTPKTAEHIQKHQGGDVVATFDDTTHRFDPKNNKVVPLQKKAEAA